MPFDNPTLIITDASCLIILDNIGYLDILPKLFDTVVTTPEIAAEYGKAIPQWLILIKVNNVRLQSEFAQMVDPGEASAIALAHEITYDYLVTDDLQARKLSIKLGLHVVGTLGLLLKAKQIGVITLLKPVLEQMKQTDFRVTQTLIEAILRSAGE
jgi:predicted nucleic acid-binding protein